MSKKLGKKIGDVFEVLSSGKFICESSLDRKIKSLYAICEQNEEYLADYFENLGYFLEKGNGYFFLSKEGTPSMEYYDKKLKNFLDMIKLVEFMLVYDNTFGVGSKVSDKEMALSLEKNLALRDRLTHIKRSEGKMTDVETCKSIMKEFVKMGYAEVENEFNGLYKIVDSYAYLENFIDAIREINNEK